MTEMLTNDLALQRELKALRLQLAGALRRLDALEQLPDAARQRAEQATAEQRQRDEGERLARAQAATAAADDVRNRPGVLHDPTTGTWLDAEHRLVVTAYGTSYHVASVDPGDLPRHYKNALNGRFKWLQAKVKDGEEVLTRLRNNAARGLPGVNWSALAVTTFGDVPPSPAVPALEEVVGRWRLELAEIEQRWNQPPRPWRVGA
jgi:hypothetical protein